MAATLVTGAAGFVGRHLLSRLAADGPVTGWHRPGPAPPPLDGVTWRSVELQDRAAVAAALAADRPAAIYHCAGVANVGDSWAQAEDTLASNVVGMAHLVAGLRALDLPARVVVTGSATIYRASSEPLTEDSPLAPNTPYGTSKLAQEMVALTAWREHGIAAVVTRSFNHIGPGQSPAFAAASFARQLALIEAGLAAPTLAVGNLAAARDVSDVRDTVRAYIALMADGVPGTCYNVCSGRAVTVQALLDGLRARVDRAGRGRGRSRAHASGGYAGDRRQPCPDHPRHRLGAVDLARRNPRRLARLLAGRGSRRNRLTRLRPGRQAERRLTRRTKSEIVRTPMAKASSPALFDLGDSRPTTRDIAALVKEGGLAALPDAVQRADHATYQEIRCRSALNRVEGMPFRWTLNPYRGCTHGCHYCFARRYQHQLELGEGDDFASVIFVKTNFVEVLRRELARPGWSREQPALGTATDPYQPIEGRYALTRGALEACRDADTPVGIVTKGPMVVRDIDVLQAIAARASCSVYLSVPSIDEDAWRRLEPGTAPPLQRLRAVRALADAGLHCGVLMAPLVPGVTTRASLVEATMKAAADHGARSVGAMVLHLEGGTRTHFMRVLAREYPHLVDGYERLFTGKYAAAGYSDEVQKMVGLLKAKYGVSHRRRPAEPDVPGPLPETPRQMPMRFVRSPGRS